MLNQTFKISERFSGSAIISWTAPGLNYISWLFVNGILIQGPIFAETLKRSVPIRFSKGLNKVIEIHEFATNITTPDTITVKENDRPSIEWNADNEAIQYKIFHTPFGGSESEIAKISVVDDRTQFKISSPIRLVEGWHFFRVESINKFGIQSTRENFRYRAFRIPKPIASLVVANGSGSGLFNITITE